MFLCQNTDSHTLIHCPSTLVSELPMGRPCFNVCKVGKRTHTKSVCFHLCHSSDCVLVFTRKMGLCRAQRLESPKASRQILFLQSVMPHFASPLLKSFQTRFAFCLTSRVWTYLLLFSFSHCSGYQLLVKLGLCVCINIYLFSLKVFVKTSFFF